MSQERMSIARIVHLHPDFFRGAASMVISAAVAAMLRPPQNVGRAIIVPKHKPKGAAPPPNPKAERRKMLAVRAMQERKRRQKAGQK